jgi:hypothetical protein
MGTGGLSLIKRCKQEHVILMIYMFLMKMDFTTIKVMKHGLNGGKVWILRAVDLLSILMMALVTQQVTILMKRLGL